MTPFVSTAETARVEITRYRGRGEACGGPQACKPAAAPLPCGAAGMRLGSRAFKGARPSKIGGEMSSEGIVADPNMPVLADADLDGLYLAALEPYPYLMTQRRSPSSLAGLRAE